MLRVIRRCCAAFTGAFAYGVIGIGAPQNAQGWFWG